MESQRVKQDLVTKQKLTPFYNKMMLELGNSLPFSNHIKIFDQGEKHENLYKYKPELSP